jgi:hypothetical protein
LERSLVQYPIFVPSYRNVLDQLEHSNANIFITGRTRRGKSTLLRHRLVLTAKTVAALSPSDVAALDSGGTTIHRLAVCGITRCPVPLKRSTFAWLSLPPARCDRHRRNCHVRCRHPRLPRAFPVPNGSRSGLPFGGVQLVMVGDLGQLLSVVTADARPIFCGDDFRDVLDAVCVGNVSQAQLDWLNAATVGEAPRRQGRRRVRLRSGKGVGLGYRRVGWLRS